MKRRTFVKALGGTGMLAQAQTQNRKTNYYLLENYFLRQSTQLARMHEFMSKGFLPAAAQILPGPKICLEALVAAHMPQYAVILGFESLDQMAGARAKLRENAQFSKAFAAWENGPEPPYEHYTQTLLRATDYSPEIVPLPERPKTPRVFELRVYHSPTRRQLTALHERFAGPEIRIFHRVGIHPILYTETVFGANQPNLTYLTPFDSLAAREKAWDAFGADPEWQKVRQESIERAGQISSVIDITLFRPAAYSPTA
jgi:NIPSNAP